MPSHEGSFSALRRCRSGVLTLCVLLLTNAGPTVAADAPLPAPADVKALAVHPATVALRGADDAAQLVVTATLADGRLVDLTHDVKYSVADGKTVAVSPTGRLAARANGSTAVVAAY